MKDIEIVLENLTSQGIKLDQAQKFFLETFIDLDSLFKPPSFFSKNSSLGSIYLWGPVGRGKTMLLKAIVDSYFPSSGKFHFIEFMQLVHKNLSELPNEKDPLKKVVKKIAKKYDVIFIDEFQIEDIADAMIAGVLIESLVNDGVRMMISSNSNPDNLYKDGLQRNKFLKTIYFIQSKFRVFNLLGTEDYRLREIISFDDSTDGEYTNQSVKLFLEKTFNSNLTKNLSFVVNGREFSCCGYSKKLVWLSFERFFLEPCGNKDFIEMIKTFDWIFISEFHDCNDEQMDKIRRFISFIDIAYQEKQKLKLFFEPDLLQNLYHGDQLKALWRRSASRLHQISSKKYLKNLEKNQTK